MVRAGMQLMLEQERGLEVCETFGDATRLLEAIERHRPHLLILDINLPDTNGIEVLKQVKAQVPQLKVLVVSMHKEEVYAERALRAGADGYVMKKAPPEELVHAVHHVLGGEVVVSDRMASRMVRQLRGEQVGTTPTEVLTDRELEAFELIGQGVTTGEIADRMNISVKTVQYYCATIKKKFHLKDAAALRRAAYDWTTHRLDATAP